MAQSRGGLGIERKGRIEVAISVVIINDVSFPFSTMYVLYGSKIKIYYNLIFRHKKATS
jgi:hypothetical protein